MVISDIEISEAGDYNFTLEPLPDPRREPLLVCLRISMNRIFKRSMAD